MDIVSELLGTARIAAKRKVVNLYLPDGAGKTIPDLEAPLHPDSARGLFIH